MMASTYQRYSTLYQARNTSEQNCTHGHNSSSHDPSTTKTRQRVAITQEAGYHLWSMVDTIHPALCSLLYRYLNGRTWNIVAPKPAWRKQLVSYHLWFSRGNRRLHSHPYVYTCQYHLWSICAYYPPIRCVHESVSLSLFPAGPSTMLYHYCLLDVCTNITSCSH